MSPTNNTPDDAALSTALAKEVTRFLTDPSDVLDAATADPSWGKSPLETLDRHLTSAGYGPEARRQIVEGARHMDAMGSELLSALGL